jgi:hypothetical protein
MTNIEPIVGAAIKGARKIAGIVGAGAKDVHPIYKESFPPKPPTGKPIDLKNPPKVPMKQEPKQPHKSERHDTEPQNQNPKTPKKDKPMVLPGRGKFSGDIARYNWTGK